MTAKEVISEHEPEQHEIQLKESIVLLQRANPVDENALLVKQFELAEYLVEKRRNEEAIELLLECVAIDRNWEGRKAQTLLTDVFKTLGSADDLVIQSRKRLLKLLF